MNNKTIRALKVKLSALQVKYEKLTNQLIAERNSTTSDNSENLYYILTERELLSRQIQATKTKLQSNGQFTSTIKTIPGIVSLGSKIRLKNHTHELNILLVPSDHAEPKDGLISNLSPIGKAVLGKKIGEEIKVGLPQGLVKYRIKEII